MSKPGGKDVIAAEGREEVLGASLPILSGLSTIPGPDSFMLCSALSSERMATPSSSWEEGIRWRGEV